MADQISNIVDPKVYADLQKTVDGIVAVETELDKANGKILTIQVDLKGASNLTAITAAIEKQNEALAAQTDIIQKNSTATTQLNTVTQQYGQATGEVVIKTANASKEVRLLQSNLEVMERQLAGMKDKTSSFAVGLSKNISNARSEIERLSPQLKVMGANVAQTGEAFKIMGINVESLFTRMAIRMVAMQLLFQPIIQGASDLWEWLNKLSDAEQKVADGIKRMDDAQKGFNETVASSKSRLNAATRDEAIELANLIKLYKESVDGTDMRVKSYDKLQSKYGTILQALTDEEKATGKVTQAHQSQMDKLEEYVKVSEKFTESQKQVKAAIEVQEEDKRILADINKNINPQITEGISILSKNTNATNNDIAQGRDRFTKNDMDVARAYTKALNDIQVKESLITIEKNNQYLLEKRITELENVKEKKPHPKHDAKLAMEAELKIAEENRKQSQDIAQKAYANSKQTEQDKINLLTATVNAEMEGKQKEFDILDKYAGKIGETETQELARRKTYQEKYADLEAKSAQTRHTINAEIQAEYAKADGYNKAYIEQLEQTSKKMAELESDLQDKKALFAAYAKTSGLNLFGENDKPREAIERNFPISQGENKVRVDNANLNEASGKLQSANDNVTKAEQTPFNNRDFDAYNELLKKKNEAQKKYDEILLQTTTDTNAQTDLINQTKKDKEDEENEKKKQGLKEIADLSVQLAQETAQAIITIQDNQFAKEQQQLEIKQRELEISSKQQMDTINATTEFQVTKDNQLAKLAAQTAAEQNAIQAEQNALAIKKAKFDKQAAEAGIVMNTALAITKIWATSGIDFPVAVAETAIVATIGAVQYAAAASAPIPQFEHGGTVTGDGSHRTILAGEAGRELMTLPSGELRMADKKALYNVPVGTEITPNHITEVLIRNAAQGIGLSAYDIKAISGGMTDDRIVKKLDNLIDTTIDIHRNTRTNIKNIIVVNTGNDLQLRKR